jgi:altronate dehydratase
MSVPWTRPWHPHRAGIVVHGLLQCRGRGGYPVGGRRLCGPFFPTGQGNIIGNPIEPVIKLTANPRTAGDMSEHIDYDCSAILRGEMTLDESGDNLLDMLIRTCEGRLTAQEVLGHEEFVLTKLYESA